MKVLIIGSGGREHTIIWKLSQDKNITKIYAAPGNAGISELAECVNILPTDFKGLKDFVKSEKIDYTIVGPEDPLVMGIVDEFEKENLKIFGPKKDAAIIEGSKAFSKELMKKYNIPTAKYEVFEDYIEAFDYIKTQKLPIVIKADGLAAGKGVVICKTISEAEKNLKEIMLDKKIGDSGAKVVIEECLTGHEVSILAFCDGKTIKPMVSAQDHKRIYDGDLGPNTGGMGTFSPSRYYTDEIAEACQKTIFEKTVYALNQENRKFVGIIFFGLMLTEDGAKVIEYNARFGDPETQVVLPRLKTELMPIFIACINSKLHEIDIEWEDSACTCVIVASGGYPEKFEKGFEIFGLEDIKKVPNTHVFHSGTKLINGKIVTNGGRVLGITSKSRNLDLAISETYDRMDSLSFKNMYFRKDIGIK